MQIRGKFGLKDMYDRMRNVKPPLQVAAETIVNDPKSYTRPDRFLGLQGRPNEPKMAWAPGYKKKHMRLKVLKKRIKVTSSRPYFPILTDKAEEEVEKLITKHIVQGSEPE